jgi:predicted tellurium resistance membrane protein TerC
VDRLEDFMRGFVWLALAALLLLVWIGSFVMYHVAGFLIHLLLIFAVISLLIHLFTRRRPT